MFEVLVFVFENYWRGDACPELPTLGRKLSAVGFEAAEIEEALHWLDGLNFAADAAQATQDLLPQSANSLRVYSTQEQEHLGASCLGFICFLESAGVLPPAMREIVVDRAMAAPGHPVAVDDLKIIVMMVYWRFGKEPDSLILDELTDDKSARVAH